jgi:hypothetical protein
LAVASDALWDKRGFTRRCNSLSGCAVAFGLRTALPLGIEAMSSACTKCARNIDHEPDACSKNCTGSSKGMEAAGAAKIVSRLFADPTNECCVDCLATDDDSLVRKSLTHSHKDQLDTLKIPWPRCQGENGPPTFASCCHRISSSTKATGSVDTTPVSYFWKLRSRLRLGEA